MSALQFFYANWDHVHYYPDNLRLAFLVPNTQARIDKLRITFYANRINLSAAIIVLEELWFYKPDLDELLRLLRESYRQRTAKSLFVKMVTAKDRSDARESGEWHQNLLPFSLMQAAFATGLLVCCGHTLLPIPNATPTTTGDITAEFIWETTRRTKITYLKIQPVVK